MSRTVQKIGAAVNDAIRKVGEWVEPIDPLGSKVLTKTADVQDRLNTNENIQLAAKVAGAVVGAYYLAPLAAGGGATTAAGSATVAGGSYSAATFGTAAGYGGATAATVIPSATAAATSGSIASAAVGAVKTAGQVYQAAKTVDGILNKPVVDTPSTLPVGYGVGDFSSVPNLESAPEKAGNSAGPVVSTGGVSDISPLLATGLIVGTIGLMIAARKAK